VSIALLALIALGAFAVLITALRFVIGREQQALLALARRTACTRCGAALGDEAVMLADTLWERHMQKLFEGGAVKSRIVRNLDAVCPRCGARYQLDAKAKSFVPVEVALSFEAK
jgi:hypothetical protein